MRLRQFLFIPLSFFILLWNFAGYPSGKAAEIEKIDTEIQQLEQMKLGFEGRALRHENQAEYLQFNDEAVLETRRHLQLAAENWRKAAQAQERIDDLKARKKELQ